MKPIKFISLASIVMVSCTTNVFAIEPGPCVTEDGILLGCLIEENQGRIIANEASITTTNGRVVSLIGDISALDDAYSTAISDNETAIRANLRNTGTNAEEIVFVQDDIGEDRARISANETRITANEESLRELNDIFPGVDNFTRTNDTAIAIERNRVNALRVEIYGNDDTSDDYDQNFPNSEGIISRVDANQERLDLTEAATLTNTARSLANDTFSVANNGRIVANEVNIADNERRITGATLTGTNNQERILLNSEENFALTLRIEDTNGRVDTVVQAVDGVGDAILALDEYEANGTLDDIDEFNTNRGRITGNETQGATNAAGIATNRTNIATVNTRVGIVEQGVVSNSAGISNNRTHIGANTAGITTNAGSITANFTSINTNTADIGSVNTRVDNTNTRVGVVEQGVNRNSAGISNNRTRIGANDTSISNNEARISSNKARIEDYRSQAYKGIASAAAFALIPDAENGHFGLGASCADFDGTSECAIGAAFSSEDGTHKFKAAFASDTVGVGYMHNF